LTHVGSANNARPIATTSNSPAANRSISVSADAGLMTSPSFSLRN
jgi:hypothetical protein